MRAAPVSVLFVCLGNICRSPAAEIIFRRMVEDAGLEQDWHIDSAGTLGYHEGSPPDARMVSALRSKGYRIFGRSRPIHLQDLEHFDWIITMDEMNFQEVRSLDESGRFHEKIRPMVSFCRQHDVPAIPDPYYGGQQGFLHVIELLEDGCAGVLEELSRRP